MRRIELFDVNMNNIGTLTLDGNGSRYWGMSRDVQIGDADNGRQWQDTFSFSCLADDVTGDTVSPLGYFMWQGANAKWYLYAIQSVATSSRTANENIMTINAVNALADDLNTKTFAEISYEMPTSDTVFRYCLQNSDWEINKLDAMTTGGTSLELSGDNAMSAFSSAVTAFKAEVDAYVEYDQYGNLHRCVDIVQHLYPYMNANMGDTIDEESDVVDTNGDSTNYLDNTQGRTLSYRHGLAGFTRTEDRTQLYTRLHVKGMKDATFADINGGKDWIQDDKANDLWNGGRDTYREGTVSVDNIAQKQAIMDWGKKQLKIYNHPAFTYEITTAYMDPDDMPERGETLAVVNFDVVPNLTIIAEVFAQHTSDDNPAEDTIALGEIRTLNAITPSYIQNKLNQLTKAVTKAKADASSVKPVALTPDGNNFTDPSQTKRLILQAWEGSTNISSYIDSKGFIWRRHNPDGTIDTNYEQTGYLVQAPYNAVGALSGTIETGYIQNDPEIKLDTSNIKRVGNFLPTNTKIATTGRQYMCQLSNGGYIGSQAVHGNTLYMLQDSNGYVVSAMTVVKGGHGASFDVEETDGKLYIWGSVGTNTKTKNYSIARFPYVGGATLQSTDSRIKRYITENKYIRVSVDIEHGYVLTSDSAGNEEVLKLSDVKAGNYNVQYSINIANYGFDLKNQTYQSQTLSFPYLIFHSGNMNMHDKRMMYAVNVVHGGQEFAVDELNDIDLGITDDNVEPETCHLMYSANNELLLFLTFHCRPANDQITSNQFTRVITIPIIVRTPASKIDEGTINGNDNTNN